ncbi:hypothetical protein SASPL_157154 [Salvia splendens]|uniref:Uncharacterized protein n=1 Tax=Salvia splendens TaxID=180675 RepID=A0A8X8YVJ0_SALSN|nr:hypothetical protein SASPL_157154 [Salvia splendens]
MILSDQIVLPSKSIKGLRSASDQIDEATKSIRYMQNKVRQLKVKRDKMMKSAENKKGHRGADLRDSGRPIENPAGVGRGRAESGGV